MRKFFLIVLFLVFSFFCLVMFPLFEKDPKVDENKNWIPISSTTEKNPQVSASTTINGTADSKRGSGEVSVEFKIPGYYLNNFNEKGYVVKIPGCMDTGEEGAPTVPAYLIKLALPPNAEADEIIIEEDQVQRLPVKKLAITEPCAITPDGKKPMPYTKKELNDYYPEMIYKFHASELRDGNSEGTLVIYPLQFEPGNGFNLHHTLKFRLRFRYRMYTEKEKEALIPPAWKDAGEMFSRLGELKRGKRKMTKALPISTTVKGTAYKGGYTIADDSLYLSSIVSFTTWHEEIDGRIKTGIKGLNIENKQQRDLTQTQQFAETFGTNEFVSGKEKILNIVKEEWSESEAVVVCRVGDRDCEVAASPLASYMNWPLLPYEGIPDSNKIREIASCFGAKYIIAAGDIPMSEQNRFTRGGFRVIHLQNQREINLLNTYAHLNDWEKGVKSNLPDPLDNFYRKEIVNKDFNFLFKSNSPSISNSDFPAYSPGSYLVLYSIKYDEMDYSAAAQVLGSYRGAVILGCSYGSPDLIRDEIDNWGYQYVALMGDGDSGEIPAWDISDPIDDGTTDCYEPHGLSSDGVIFSDFYYEIDINSYNSSVGTTKENRSIPGSWEIDYYVGRVVGINEAEVLSYTNLIKKYEFGLTQVAKNYSVSATENIATPGHGLAISNSLYFNGGIANSLLLEAYDFTKFSYLDILDPLDTTTAPGVTVAYAETHGFQYVIIPSGGTLAIEKSEIEAMKNSLQISPFLQYTTACLTGCFMGDETYKKGGTQFEEYESPDEQNCIGVSFISSGAIGFIGPTMNAYGDFWFSRWACALADYFFQYNVTTNNYSLGNALAVSKRGLWYGSIPKDDHDKKTIWEFILIGDPAVNIQMADEGNPTTNHNPSLTNPTVEPSSGYTTTEFTFKVHHYDEDGDYPKVIQCNIVGPNDYSIDIIAHLMFGESEWWNGVYITDGIYLPYAGTYTFQWWAQDEYDGEGYSTSSQFQVSPSSDMMEVEPNNDHNSANSLAVGTTKGRINPLYEQDWFKVYCSCGGTIKIDVLSPPDTGHEFTLLDSGLQELACIGTSPGASETINHSTSIEDTFYLKVIGDPLPGGFYTLNYQFTPYDPVWVSILTDPIDKKIIIDGHAYSSPKSFNWHPGTQHWLDVVSPQDLGSGMRYVFDYWNDGGEKNHSIYVPNANSEYTAAFYVQYSLKTSASPEEGGSVSPGGESWYNATAQVNVEADANPGYIFTGWSGSIQGTENPTSFYMDGPKNITANFAPEYVSITITSSPVGRQITIDGVNYTAPQTFQWQPGSGHTLGTDSPQAGGTGVQYIYDHWSNGESQNHSITVPSIATAYTVYFNSQYLLTTSVNLPAGGSVDPSGSNWFSQGDMVNVQATSNTGFQFSGWSGQASGTDNPLEVTMDRPKNIVANFETLTFPEIDIKQDTTAIPDGGNYDFGQVEVGNCPGITFTIENNGDADLTLDNLPLQISGTHADQFNISPQPTSPVLPGQHTTFTVNFCPTTEGEKTALISIDNNDGDENPYEINLSGTGIKIDIKAAIVNQWGDDAPPLKIFGQDAVLGEEVIAPLTEGDEMYNLRAFMDPLPLHNACPGTGAYRDADMSIISRITLGNQRELVLIRHAGGRGDYPGSEGYVQLGNGWSIDEVLSAQGPDYSYSGSELNIDTENGRIEWQGRTNDSTYGCLENHTKISMIVEKNPVAPFYSEFQSTQSTTADIEAAVTNQWGSGAPPIKIFGQDAGVGQAITAVLNEYEEKDSLCAFEDPLPVYSECPGYGHLNGDTSIISRITLGQGRVLILVRHDGAGGVNPGSEGYVQVGDGWHIEKIISASINTDSYGYGVRIDRDNGTIEWQGRSVCSSCICHASPVFISVVVREGPTVTTKEVTADEATSAVCGGDVTDDNGAPVTAKGVCWSISPNPTLDDDHTVDGSGTGPFDSFISGLSPATTYYVRAYATNSVGINYGSEKEFTTKAFLELTSFNDGNDRFIGENESITWNTEGVEGNLKITLWQNRNLTGTIAENIDPAATSYEWSVGFYMGGVAVPGSGYTIKIEEMGSDVSDSSEVPFNIHAPFITVTAPNGGEEPWDVGTEHLIEWNWRGLIESVTILYSTDGGASWRFIISDIENSGSYMWTIPDTPSSNCLVRISGGDTDDAPFDISDSAFTINMTNLPALTVTSPNGGERLQSGSHFAITWIPGQGITDVTIDYSTDSGVSWENIVPSTDNDGSYDWTVPGTPSNSCLMRVSDGESDGGPSDRSDALFSILTPEEPVITITFPNGGEKLYAGSLYEITWTNAGTGSVENVKIEYSIDSGNYWEEIIAETENDGTYEWVPDTPSENCLVRISDIDGDPSDVSDGEFSILSPMDAEITLTSPNGGESLANGLPHVITWGYFGTDIIETVVIEYSPDGGESWEIIVQEAENSSTGGTYDWTVPDTPSDDCLVRISGLNMDNGPVDVSDAVFSITGTTACAESWSAANYSGGETISSITYGNSKFVAAGSGGMILTGSDGENWQIQSSGTTVDLKGVTYGDNKFVAVGADGVILTAPEGENWALQPSPAAYDLLSVTYGNGIFAAVGVQGTILTSPDAVTWDIQSPGVTYNLNSITYGENMFAAAGDGGIIVTSPDGGNWDTHSSGTTNALYGMTYGNGRFAAVGEQGVMVSSTDGTNWKSRRSIINADLRGVTYGNSTYVVVGQNGEILTSEDGLRWSYPDPGVSNDLLGVVYENSRFIAVGAGIILYSLCN